MVRYNYQSFLYKYEELDLRKLAFILMKTRGKVDARFHRFASPSLNTKFNKSWSHYRCLSKRMSLFNDLKDQGLALVLMKTKLHLSSRSLKLLSFQIRISATTHPK